jgi:hypothetical protein
LSVVTSDVGGNWGISSDTIGAGLGFAEISYTNPQGTPFSAVQVTDATGQAVAAGQALTIQFAPASQPGRLFLPAGAYRLLPPAGQTLLEHGFPPAKTRLNVGGQISEDYFLTIPAEAPVQLSYSIQ